jgi:uncharacterized Zn-finger protein
MAGPSVKPEHARDTAVEVQPADLRGSAIFCPNPKMPLWSNHPRVFIDVGTTGSGRCPYCGTPYRLAGGALAAGH